MNHCDNPEVWQKLLLFVIVTGINHASRNQRPLTEGKLIAFLRSSFGPFGYRRGHATYLRTAYGAAYNGITLTQSVKTTVV